MMIGGGLTGGIRVAFHAAIICDKRLRGHIWLEDAPREFEAQMERARAARFLSHRRLDAPGQ